MATGFSGMVMPMTKTANIKDILFNKRMLICIFTGFSSGLPLFILFSLIPTWLRSEHIDLKTIGLFALIQLPFTWKFLWAPLFDRYVPFLGRRRGWLIIWQILLLISLAFIGKFDAHIDIRTIAALATIIAFFSASQDVVIDAYRREILLTDQDLEMGNGLFVSAYRISSLIPGSLSLILSDHMEWYTVFLITASFMTIGIFSTIFMVREPELKNPLPTSLKQAIFLPFQDFIKRMGWKPAAIILTFIFLYKLGDSMATSLASAFYLDMGFSKTEIGLIAKNAGLWPSIAGGILGGIWTAKIGLNRALWIFGIIQMVAILGFCWLAIVGHDLFLLGLVIGFEALGVGLGTAAFVTFISKNTNPIYTATQFALFTSLAAVPRTFGNAASGFIVEWLGWVSFFLFCFVIAIPGMLLLIKVAPWTSTEK